MPRATRASRTTASSAAPGPAVPTHPLLAKRRAGVLLHLTSLPSRFGAGDLGPEAFAFADWLAAAGVSVWQMLPVGPVGFGDSPYSSPSSFAIEPTFLALEPLVEAGLLAKRDLRAPARLAKGDCDFAASRALRMPLYAKAAAAFRAAGGEKSREFRGFVRDTAWLDAWLDFVAGDDADLRATHAFVQFELARRWAAFRLHCASRGVALVGDVPIFVTAESADVRANPKLFRLDAKGRPEVLTGVPPDGFSADGQLWGHPHYAWPAHRRERFAWWIARIACAAERFDLVRIDHFIGFHHAYEVPAGARNARKGAWRRAPGRELLAAMAARFGALPLIAEDLGALTPEVEALRDDFGLAGMRIVQNAFWSGVSGDLPHNHPRRAVAYTGTHDNETSVQWWANRPKAERARFRAYAGGGPVHEAIARLTLASPAALAVLPMQDLLGLGAAARMNLPGTATGNWRWRMAPRAATAALAKRLRAMVEATGRL
ncbi:MAG: 4-alpha-glucanotransferase [Planctomycetota bacterium]